MVQDAITPYIYKKPIILNRDETALSAACAMDENGVGCVMVAGSGGEIIGILTDRDLTCRLIARGTANGSINPHLRLDEIMTPDPVTVDQMSSILDVIEAMRDYGIRRIPVVQKGLHTGDRAKCLGIVTLDDLMASGAIDQEDLKQVVKSQVQIRERGIPNTMRSVARMKQSRQGFYKTLCEELSMSEGAVRQLMSFLLGSIVKRMQPSAAQRLLSPFPKLIRAEFEAHSVGPDKSITGETLITGVMARFSRKREPAVELIAQFWQALADIVGERVLANAVAKLPRDIAELLAAKTSQPSSPTPERKFGNESFAPSGDRSVQRSGYVAADTVNRSYHHH